MPTRKIGTNLRFRQVVFDLQNPRQPRTFIGVWIVIKRVHELFNAGEMTYRMHRPANIQVVEMTTMVQRVIAKKFCNAGCRLLDENTTRDRYSTIKTEASFVPGQGGRGTVPA